MKAVTKLVKLTTAEESLDLLNKILNKLEIEFIIKKPFHKENAKPKLLHE